MKQFKILSIFLSLVTHYSSYSVLIDKFEDSESGVGKVDVNESELSSLGVSAERDRGVGIRHNKDTGNLHYEYGKHSFVNYQFTPELNMQDIPIVRVNMDSLPAKAFSNTVTLTDNYDDYIQLGPQTVNGKQQDFDFTNQFNSIKYPGEGQFNFKQIAKVQIDFNSTGGDGPQYNPVVFEVESVEAVPEPFSLITLGTGLATFIKKRKFKKQI